MAVDKFGWLYLVELLICGILSIFFLFYFNRLFASVVSYAIRTYLWRQYHVYINIQALQISLLGGRCFFKGFRYHGHNETILINDGYITWRYWLRRVRNAEVLDTATTASQRNGEEEGRDRSTQPVKNRRGSSLPCRIKLKVRGVEWFIYNRTPAYEAIERSLSVNGKPTRPASKSSQRQSGTNRDVPQTEKHGTYPEGSKEEIFSSSDADKDWTEKETGESGSSGKSFSASAESLARNGSDKALTEPKPLPVFLMLLPIKIECSKAAIVMGSSNTRSALTAKFDTVNGCIDARRAQTADLYKQMFEFDFAHPVIEIRPNYDWNKSRDAKSTRISGNDHHHTSSISQGHSHSIEQNWSAIVPIAARNLIQKCKMFLFPLLKTGSNRRKQGVTDFSQIPGQDQWLGLTRYLDDDDNIALEQERWRAIEYGEHPIIVDSPKVTMSLYWDVPGLVPEPFLNKNLSGDGEDINREAPPDWGLGLRIHGGLVSYGPWADRLRQDLQPIFFPNMYKDATPAERLSPGQSRVSTVFKLNIDIEQTTTFMIPTRESSKDWKWKDKGGTKGKAHKEGNVSKGFRRKKNHKNTNALPPGRPYGWLDVELQPDSTITFTMDLVARCSGYRNSLNLDIRSPRMSSSVNHGLLLSARKALISCDLSYPLGWKDMRQWAINVDSTSLELFLLRDHVFLLTDIINDWTAGPPGDFHTFVPFTYRMHFRFTGCNLHLNANDSNVINAPASMEENTFVTVWAENLVANLQIPLTHFRPSRNQIPFDIDAQNGGFKFSRPPWNTQHVFVKSSEVATMKDLGIEGTYEYSTSTSLEMTDVLRMNVHGISPKVYLYGFLIRAFMRIKDNYFGEDIHFRTLEEYQEQISQESIPSSGRDCHVQRTKISNDLDVILSITAVTAGVSLPSHLYSSVENVLLDIPSLGVDLRFTNYYMDLIVAFSPIALSYTSPSLFEEHSSLKASETQIFIDGLEIRGHRLFGLPPAEPTYVCNWDFDIGTMSGEFSIFFATLLSAAFSCFSFTFGDAENALQPLSLLEIHDVTYLRVHLEPVQIWVETDDAALLLACQGCNIEYNDLAKSMFSQRLHMDLPSITIAVVNRSDVVTDLNRKAIQLRPYAFFQSALKLSMLHRKYNSDQDRHLQQHHIALNDFRTNRTPWLINGIEDPQVLAPSSHPKITTPAMPYPAMPEPLHIPDTSTLATKSVSTDNSARTKSSTSLKGGNAFRLQTTCKMPLSGFEIRQREANTDKALKPKGAPTSWTTVGESSKYSTSAPTEQNHLPTRACGMGGSKAHKGFGASSSYKMPYFRLQNAPLDLSEVPALPEYSGPAFHWDEQLRVSSDTDSEEFPLDRQQRCERTSLLVDLGPGLRSLVKPQSLKVLNSAFEKLQVKDPEGLLDELQMHALECLPDSGKEPDHRRTITEARIRLPCFRLRLLEEAKVDSRNTSRNVTCDFNVDECIVTAQRRNSALFGTDAHLNSMVSAHVMLNQADISIKVSHRQPSRDYLIMHLILQNIGLWGCKDADLSVHARFKDLEVKHAMTKADSLPLLVRYGQSLAEDVRHMQDVAMRQIDRLRQLVLSLTIDGQELPDPPFLTRASYVLRIANSQLRASQSWRLVSRLRYVYQLLPEQARATIRSRCFHPLRGCPVTAREDVVAIFRRLGMWDGDEVKESVLLNEVFGEPVEQDKRSTVSLAVKVSIRAEAIRLQLQPGKTQSQVQFETIALELMFRQLSPLSGEASAVEALASAELYCSKTTLTLNFSLLRILQDIMIAFPGQSGDTSPSLRKPISPISRVTHYRMHFVLMSELNTIALDSTSLRVLYSCRPFSSSVVISKAGDQCKMGTSFLICADSATVEVLSHSEIVSVGKVDRPSIFGNLDGEKADSAPNSWHLATSCTDVSLKVLKDPLELLTIANRVMLNEMASLKRMLSTKEHALKGSRSEPAATDIALGKPHVALFLDSYLISYKVLPALSYRVTGKVGRISVRPGFERVADVVLDFDLKEHAHAFLGRTGTDFQMISELVIPPINGHTVIGTNPMQKDVSFQSTIEHISLDAAAVHALLATLSHPELTALASSVHHESSRLTHQQGPSVPLRDSTPTPTQSTQPFLFDASITLVGMGIHTDTAKDAKKQVVSQLHFELGQVHLKGNNRETGVKRSLKFPELFIYLRGLQMGFTRSIQGQEHPCGDFTVSAVFQAVSQRNAGHELVRAYRIRSSRCETIIYTETASVVIDVLDNLRESFRDIDLTNEVKGLQKLRRATLADLDIGALSKPPNDTGVKSTALFSAMYSLELSNMRVIWRVGDSVPLSPGWETEDLVLSSTKIDLATRRENAARLLIEDFQLQMVPSSQIPTGRSLNSALLPEAVFNVAYMSTLNDRRLAFQAVGKSLDLRLTSQFIVPASNLRRSIAIAVNNIRAKTEREGVPPARTKTQTRNWFEYKRLTSLLIDADFAGAVVHIQGRSISDPESLALDVLHGRRVPQKGRYGQFTQDSSSSNTTLRAPGVAIKVEYKDASAADQSLNAEVKVDASSNVLYPSVVPLVLEISSSVKEIVGEPTAQTSTTESRPSIAEHRPSASKLIGDERLKTADPSTIFRNCTLNLGLRICRQDFSLSCQPIARVAATAQIESIYFTANTVRTADYGQSFTLSGFFSGFQASIQHAYSRESTGGLEAQAIIVSLMNSKHLGAANGISAITQISPMRISVNAKQSQDFLLFREIWLPADIRKPAPAPATSPSSEPQAYMVQRYQQIASAGAFPWNVTLSIAKLDFQVDLGQSLGKSGLVVSELWVSSKKSSNWEQNLCLGMENISLDSTGRMSGFVRIGGVQVRTTIRWPVAETVIAKAPLIQASVNFESIQIRSAFEYQAFAMAEMSGLKFIMYNLRDGQAGHDDRLVGVTEIDALRAFCTTTSASQALALYQAFERLIQEKQMAYQASLKDIEKFLRRRSTINPLGMIKDTARQAENNAEYSATDSLRLQTKVMVSLGSVNVGAFPGTFVDTQVFRLEALDASAKFAVALKRGRLHSTLGLALGQLQVALSGVTQPEARKSLGEISLEDVIASATRARGGTILKVPKVVATMQTWQSPGSNDIEYIFKSAFQGKVDVGWNYSRISFLRGMWNNHVRALAARLGKPLPQSALQITTALDEDGKGEGEGRETGREKITAVVNVPQSKYKYTPLELPIIETPQLRDMGEATPPLEWIGLHRERLPNLTHQIVIVSLLELAREVDDAYSRILGSS
ncbi:MAG: hypothetical protein Q9225_003549 [Loekoesia sp. 1 TL-2023]